jgi:hypothetical protein
MPSSHLTTRSIKSAQPTATVLNGSCGDTSSTQCPTSQVPYITLSGTIHQSLCGNHLENEGVGAEEVGCVQLWGTSCMMRLMASGKTFECTAKPYPWPHGVGVYIDIATQDQRVGCVKVMCIRNKPGFDALAALTPPELCDVALSRFAAGELGIKIEDVLRWQEQIRSLGYDYVSPLVTTFQRHHDGLPRYTRPQ